MIRFAILLIFWGALTSTSSAINLPLTSNYLEVDTFHTNYDIKVADFPGSTELETSRTLGSSSVRAYIVLDSDNSTRTAGFDFKVDLQANNLSTDAIALGHLSLYLNEPVKYSIVGSLSCTTDVPGVDFRGHWALLDGDTGIYYYLEDKRVQDTAILEADDFTDPGGPLEPSDLTGIIPAGIYAFFFTAEFDARNSLATAVHVTGSTNVTLYSLVPEPNSILVILPTLGSVLVGRSSNRRWQCLAA